MRRLMFDDYRYRLPGVEERLHKEFAVLDIFDFLSPIYDYPDTVEGFHTTFADAGLVNIDVHPGYNGIEGRGRKPADAFALLAKPPAQSGSGHGANNCHGGGAGHGVVGPDRREAELDRPFFPFGSRQGQRTRASTV